MTPALLVASCVAGLLPVLLRSELPAGSSPFVVLFDLSVRVVAALLGAALIAFVAAVEIGNDSWTATNVNLAATLASIIVGLQGIQFVSLGWARLMAASRPADARAQTVGPRSPGTAFVMTLIVTGSVALGAVEATYSSASPSTDDTVDTVMRLILATVLILAFFARVTLLIDSKIESSLPTQRSLARGLEAIQGTWDDRVFFPSSAPDVELARPVFTLNGRHFLQTKDAHALARFHRDCAASSPHPTTGLHARMLTVSPFGPHRALGRTFGFRVWTPSPARPLGRWQAHWRSRFDHNEVADLPSSTAGLLVPIDRELLRAAGLEWRRAEIQSANVSITPQPRSSPRRQSLAA